MKIPTPELMFTNKKDTPPWGGLVVSVPASLAVGRGFAPRPGHTKNHHKKVHTASLLGTHALG